MKTIDFSKLYYRSVDCLTTNHLPDQNPVVRTCGIDTNAGYSVVFTAMGSRFDLDKVAQEAFGWTESYESDAASLECIPIAETMRYIRAVAIQNSQVPAAYAEIVEKIKNGCNLYGQPGFTSAGDPQAPLLFLPGPASQLDPSAARQFGSICEALGLSFHATSEYGDCGYLLMECGLFEAFHAVEAKCRAGLAAYRRIVTDDAYVYDALQVILGGQADRVAWIDRFLFDEHIRVRSPQCVAVHESGLMQRLYPARVIEADRIFSAPLFPNRSGYRTTDTGIAGGLGFFEPEIQKRLAARRAEDLLALKADCVVTPCSAEAYGLRAAGAAVKTYLEAAADSLSGHSAS